MKKRIGGWHALAGACLGTAAFMGSSCEPGEGQLKPSAGHSATSGGHEHPAQGGSATDTGGIGGSSGDLGDAGAPGPIGGRPPPCMFHTEAPTDIRNPPVVTTGGATSGGGGQGGTTAGRAAAGGQGEEAGAAGQADFAGSGGQAAEPDAGGRGGAEPNFAGGAGGAGGAEPLPDITVQKSGFVGQYLADAQGKALYVYAADIPGDCVEPPISTCTSKDCLLAWPVFDAGLRNLPEGLDDGLFGAIDRADGLRQTTYKGWPLYYFRDDVRPGDVRGQGRGSVWHLAELVMPNIILLRVKQGEENVKAISDEFGYSLYTYSEDTLGTLEADPVSACVGECATAFPPFSLRYLSPVTYLEPSDFSIFRRPEGGTQVAYKGAPLYFSTLDTRPGQRNGLNEPGWSVVVLP